ncbi:MAG: hypothetical protein HXX81_00035 [Campylobacterales bacterium]|nr:hypothetical protein [Campylobacterales bacterium]
MNNKSLLIGATGVVLVLAFLFMQEDSSSIKSIETKQQTSSSKESKDKENDIKIVYQENKDKQQEHSSSVTTKELDTHVYELDSSTVHTSNFAIKLVSKSPIEKDTQSFPQIPAVIEGNIDGEKFVILVPMNVKNRDLKLRIEDKKTGTIKELSSELKGLKSGTTSKVDGSFGDVDKLSVQQSDIQPTDLPPSPPSF